MVKLHFSFDNYTLLILITIYNTILLFLPDESKELLKIQGISIPSEQSPPAFDYLSFCKSIDIIFLRRIISFNSSLASDQLHILQEIYSLFM